MFPFPSTEARLHETREFETDVSYFWVDLEHFITQQSFYLAQFDGTPRQDTLWRENTTCVLSPFLSLFTRMEKAEPSRVSV